VRLCALAANNAINSAVKKLRGTPLILPIVAVIMRTFDNCLPKVSAPPEFLLYSFHI
jgi:hypothetical protein